MMRDFYGDFLVVSSYTSKKMSFHQYDGIPLNNLSHLTIHTIVQ